MGTSFLNELNEQIRKVKKPNCKRQNEVDDETAERS